MVAGHEAGRRRVGDEQGADRQPVRERLGERDRVGAHIEALPGEELRPSVRRPSAPRRRRASPRSASASSRACSSVSRASGCTPPSPCTGSRTIAAVCGLTASASVSGVAKLHAGDQRLEGGALGGLAGDRERPHGAPVEGALERDELVLAGRLARPLDRGLDRLGARVAEERVRAAEAGGERRARAPPWARSSRGSRRARAARAASGRPRAAPDGSVRGRPRRCRRRGRGSAGRRRR